MKKQIKRLFGIVIVFMLTMAIALSAVACDFNSSGGNGGDNSGSGNGSGVITPSEPDKPNPDPTPSEPSTPTEPDKPEPDPEPETPTAVKPDNFTVNFDNNTTTVTVDAAWSAQSDSTYTVKVEYNGTTQTYTAAKASISLSLDKAPINEYDVSVSVKSNGNGDKYLESDYTEAETIDKLTASEYYALTTSYGVDNRYCSTKGELAVQYAYIGDLEIVDNELGYLWRGEKSTYEGECFVYCAVPERDGLLEGITDDEQKMITLHQKLGMNAAFEGSSNTATSCYLLDGRVGDEVYWMTIKVNSEQKSKIATTQLNRSDYVGTEYAVAENLNGQPLNVSATGRKDDKLPIDDSKQTIEGISLSPALYTAVINGYNVKPKAGSRAEQIWNYSRKVLKAITDENMSEKEIALAIYDWVMYRTNYNTPAADKYDEQARNENYNQYIDGILGGTDYNLGVCAAYAKSYSVLCNMAGIKCVYVSGTVGGYGHAWNKIEIDGKWYCVDTTHGDGMMTLSGVSYELGSHEYFMLSDEQISGISDGGRAERDAYYDIPNATTEYDYFESVKFTDDNGKTWSLKINKSDAEQINAVAEYFAKKHAEYIKAGGVTIVDPLDKTKTTVGKIAMFEVSADKEGMTALCKAMFAKIDGMRMLGSYNGQIYCQIGA